MKVRCGQCSEMIEAPDGWDGAAFACPQCESPVSMPELPRRSRHEMLEDRKKRRGSTLRRMSMLMLFGFFGICMLIGFMGLVEGYNYWLLPVSLLGMFGSLYASERARRPARKRSAADVLRDMGEGWDPPEKGRRVLRAEAERQACLASARDKAKDPQAAPEAKPVPVARSLSEPDEGGTPQAAKPQVAAASAPSEEVSRRDAAVLAELEKLTSAKRSFLRKAVVFVITLALFAWLGWGFFSDTAAGMGILIGVIMFHELGHYLAMRIMGYRDVSIFFIPLLGAGTSGRQLGAAGWKRAVVSLAGPLPGILLGLLLGIVYLINRNAILGETVLVLVGLNGLNLLPVFPLDGGRLFYDVLFCRNRYLDFIVKVGSGLLLGLLALAGGLWFLGIFAFFVLAGAFAFLKEEEIVARLKPDLALGDADIPDVPPPAVACRIISEVSRKANPREKTAPKALAAKVDSIWRRLHQRPPGAVGTIACLAVYGVTLFMVMTVPVFAAFTSHQSDIIEVRNSNGTRGYREVITLAGHKMSEIEVAPDGLYHGEGLNYLLFTDRIVKRGKWHRGKWHGEWKSFDPEGKPLAITYFDKGKFLRRRERVAGKWVEKRLEDLPALQRNVFEMHEREAPLGPKNWRAPVEKPATEARPE